jgi:hypothetical protein
MEAQSIIDDLQIQINQIAKKLNDSSSKIQQSIYDDIIVELSKLDQTAGDIKTSVSNLKRIQIIKDNISKIVLSPEYKDDVEVFLSGFDELQLTMDTYFTAISEEFGESPLINQIKTHFIDVTGNSLREAGIDANVIQPIENILNQYVTTGASYKDLVEQVRLLTLGNPEKLGRLSSYVKQITTDSLNQYSANYMKAISNDLNLEFYFYSGNVKDTSREFCDQRHGKYFHRKEVEAWANLSWAGKIQGTNSSNIFIYRGGYHCRHQLIPVSAASVPRSVIERAINEGYYQED